jgi:nucleotide-binding universal stress UspA family protein
VDSTRETRQKLPYTAFLASKFNSKINVLSLYSTGVKTIRDLVDNYSEQAMDYLREREIDCELFTLEADNLTDGTIDFAKNVDADLISIMTEQETSATNLLLGPYAQQMVNHSPIPVLTIRSKSIYDYQTR